MRTAVYTSFIGIFLLQILFVSPHEQCIISKNEVGENKELNSGHTHFSNRNHTEDFSRIYEECLWGYANESRCSGHGSTIEGTSETRSYLIELVHRLGVKTFLDAPCGAMAWIPLALVEIEKTISDFEYTGVDVVPSLIEKLKMEFTYDHPKWRFLYHDITSQPIHDAFDLILARDVFFHLRIDKVKCALNYFSQSGSKYILITTHPGADNIDSLNFGINLAPFRQLDFNAPPFSLSSWIEALYEPKYFRFLGLWALPFPIFNYTEDGDALDCS